MYKQYLNNALSVLNWEREIRDYNELSWIKRVFTKKPINPHPKYSIKEWLEKMVESFKTQHSIGTRLDFGQGMSVHIGFNWQADNYLPVLTITEYDGSCAYQSRRAFNSDGSFEEWGIEYPLSEMGVIGLYSERNRHLSEIPSPFINAEKRFTELTNEISNWLYDSSGINR